METLRAIAKRKSTRNFNPDRKVPEHLLKTILEAGCAAPVGAGDAPSLHLTVVQDAEALASINKNAQEALKAEGKNFLCGTPALVIVSASDKQKFPNIQYANAACMVENMLIAATDAGLDNLYLWGSMAALAGNKELCAGLGIPEGFTPVSAAALGYSDGGEAPERELTISRTINYV
ncbi:MAG: nitroreductase family protein [Clostridia bacterium]|nr:nitroreductase family protein [Clostridia bacterium]